MPNSVNILGAVCWKGLSREETRRKVVAHERALVPASQKLHNSTIKLQDLQVHHHAVMNEMQKVVYVP